MASILIAIEASYGLKASITPFVYQNCFTYESQCSTGMPKTETHSSPCSRCPCLRRAERVLGGDFLPAAGIHWQQSHNPDCGRTVDEGDFGAIMWLQSRLASHVCCPSHPNDAPWVPCCISYQAHAVLEPMCVEDTPASLYIAQPDSSTDPTASLTAGAVPPVPPGLRRAARALRHHLAGLKCSKLAALLCLT